MCPQSHRVTSIENALAEHTHGKSFALSHAVLQDLRAKHHVVRRPYITFICLRFQIVSTR